MRTCASRSGRSRSCGVALEPAVDVRPPLPPRRLLAGRRQLQALGQLGLGHVDRARRARATWPRSARPTGAAPAVLGPRPGERRVHLVRLAGAVADAAGRDGVRRAGADQLDARLGKRLLDVPSRRCPYGPKSAATWTRVAPTSRAARSTSSTGSPCATDSRPSSSRSDASRERSERDRYPRRPGPAGPHSAGSRTKSGRTPPSAAHASSRAGLSASRRSRRNHITAVIGHVVPVPSPRGGQSDMGRWTGERPDRHDRDVPADHLRAGRGGHRAAARADRRAAAPERPDGQPDRRPHGARRAADRRGRPAPPAHRRGRRGSRRG